MSSRKDVLKPFAEKRSYMEDRVHDGIENHRKTLTELCFVNEKNEPVTHVHAEIRQKTHEFKYGANLFMLDEFPEREQNEAYRKIFAETFNMATLPFYWSDLEPEQGKPRFSKTSPKIYRRPVPDLCLEYCEANGIMPKAHCLNYASFLPKWVPRDVREEKFLLEKRFSELASRYARRIRDWEVTNETFWGPLATRSAFYNEPDFVEWSFETADRYFHNNRLIINEAHCRIWDDPHFFFDRSPYYMQIERALAKGSRIDSVGMQYHMFYRPEVEALETAPFYDPERIYSVLDTYAKLGRPVQITELTIPAYDYTAPDEEIQAEIIRNIYSMWFSHPAMEAILYWNVVDGFAAYAPQGDLTVGENFFRGGLVRYDFTPKPALATIRNLFEKEWRTNLSLDSGNGNSMTLKGFRGDYELLLTAAGKTVKKSFILSKSCAARTNIVL